MSYNVFILGQSCSSSHILFSCESEGFVVNEVFKVNTPIPLSETQLVPSKAILLRIRTCTLILDELIPIAIIGQTHYT
jgi:hypothetical protein